jgi:gliding motility-associated-like protein/uncharacterized repeat protein (TIGR01451 family)
MKPSYFNYITVKGILLFLVFVFSESVFAQLQTPFTPRFNETIRGDFTMIANNMLSRSATGNYNGTSNNHNFTDNVYVDIDSDATTFNSSSADLANPETGIPCLSIRKAYLYWAAADRPPIVSDADSENQPDWNFNDVKLMLPGESSYATYTADEVIFRGRDISGGFSNDPYICFKDITDEVINLSNPYGKYQVANVEAKEGSVIEAGTGSAVGTSGGWQIVFVYESPTLPTKNITLFDGYAHVTRFINNFDITVGGFQTIPVGPVSTDIIVGALEGDFGLSGDQLQILNTSNNFVDISTPLRSSNNFFNSKITRNNADFIERNPVSLNTLGFDAAEFSLDNPSNSIIANNQTSATLRLTSNQETYGLYLLGFAVDVWAPNLDPIEIMMTSGSNPTSPGDNLAFNFVIENNGNDDAVNVQIATTVPEEIDFTPGILPSGVTFTYDSTTRELIFFVADDLVDIGSPPLNIDFEFTVKDQCYFLEESCSDQFELQFEATYNGVLNPNEQLTLSSSGLDACQVGNLEPNIITINRPDPAVWATPSGNLDVTLSCGDVDALNNAQNLEPVTDKCNFTLIKTSGDFVSDGTCTAAGTYTNTWIFEDSCGVSSPPFIQTITIIDPGTPSIDTPAADLSVECDGAGNTTQLNDWLAANGGAVAADACSTVTWSNDFSVLSDLCGATGSATVTFTATDDCGNASSTTATFTIEDTTAPVIDTPAADLNVACDGAGNTTQLNDWLAANGGAVAADACSTVTWSNDFSVLSDLCGATGSATVTFTATDDCGNASSTTATFTIEDTTAPVIDTPAADLSVECDGAGNTTQLNDWLATNGGAVAADACSTVTWSNDFSVLSDLCGATGSATVTFTATDDCGNASSTTATFTIEDTTAPVIDTPAADLSVECDGAGNTTQLNDWLATNGGAVAADACSTVTWSNDFSVLSDLCGATGSATVTFTATDDCGNASSTTATFTIEDTTAPAIDTPAADLNVACDGAGNTTQLNDWLATNGGAVAADACSTVTWSNDFSVLSDLCGATGSATVTFTATDDCGNASSTTATFTIEDITAPVIDTPAADLSVECDGAGNTTQLNDWLATNGGAVAADACSTVTWSNDFSVLSDLCGATGSATVTFTATDDCGNASSTTATFTIEDTTAPAIDTPAADLNVACDGAGNTTQLNDWLAANGGAVAADACSTVTWSNDFSALSDLCGATGSATVTFTATDDCGNASSTTATFTIEDTTAPVIDTPAADLNVACDGAGNTTQLNDWLAANGGAVAADACSTVTWSNDFSVLSDLCGATGSATVTFTATDDCGNASSTTATFTIEDITAPVIDTPAADLSVACDGAGNTTQLNDWLATNGGAVAADACSTVTWSNDFSVLSDLCGATGSATVTFTATDDCGNASSTTATFTIEDITAPVIDTTNIQDLVIECGITPDDALSQWLSDNAGAVANDSCSSVVWTNNYDPNLDFDCTNGGVPVTFSATDACGNTSQVTATYAIIDTTPPVLAVPGDLTLECSDDTSPINTGTASATDDCTNPTISFSDSIEDNCGFTRVITRIWTATDTCGNTISANQIITVQDTTAPAFSVPGDIVLECDTDINDLSITGDVTDETDNCSNSLEATYTDEITDGLCTNSTIVLRTWTLTDDCGNSTSLTQTITLEDTTAPTFTVPDDITIECSTDINDLSITGDVNDETDNCSLNLEATYTDDISDGLCPNEAIITRTWSLTDDCDNSTSFIQIITIQDTTAPNFNEVLPEDIMVDCNAIPEIPTLTASDNCDVVDVVFEESITEGNCIGDFLITRSWTSTDLCDNTAEHVQIITVQDVNPPTLVSDYEDNITIACDDIVPSVPSLVFEDQCSNNISVSFDEATSDLDENGDYQIIRTWTVTDDCGNSSNFTQTITIENINIIIAENGSVCIEDGEFDLFTLLSGDFDTTGTWSVVSGNAEINSSLFTPESGLGDYVFRYEITQGPCPASAEVIVTVEDCDGIVLSCGQDAVNISKAVTANGDNINDGLEVTGVEDCGFVIEIQIFNRWGAKIYENRNYQSGQWQGESHGSSIGGSNKVPTGTYYYVINLRNSGLEPFTGPVYVSTND